MRGGQGDGREGGYEEARGNKSSIGVDSATDASDRDGLGVVRGRGQISQR